MPILQGCIAENSEPLGDDVDDREAQICQQGAIGKAIGQVSPVDLVVRGKDAKEVDYVGPEPLSLVGVEEAVRAREPIVQILRHTPRHVSFCKFMHLAEECCGIREVGGGAKAGTEKENLPLAVRRTRHDSAGQEQERPASPASGRVAVPVVPRDARLGRSRTRKEAVLHYSPGHTVP